MNSESAPVSNGDVEMESEDDSDDDGPLEPLPLPKVSQKFIWLLSIGRRCWRKRSEMVLIVETAAAAHWWYLSLKTYTSGGKK